jgi:hypothetical protein
VDHSSLPPARRAMCDRRERDSADCNNHHHYNYLSFKNPPSKQVNFIFLRRQSRMTTTKVTETKTEMFRLYISGWPTLKYKFQLLLLPNKSSQHLAQKSVSRSINVVINVWINNSCNSCNIDEPPGVSYNNNSRNHLIRGIYYTIVWGVTSW